MQTYNFCRKANIPSRVAIEKILEQHPSAEIETFRQVRATPPQARQAHVRPGELIYLATIHVSEDEEAPAPEKSEKSESAPPSDSGESKPKPPKPEASEDDGPPADDGPSDDGPIGEGDSADDGPDMAPKLKPEEEMVHLLKQLVDILGGGAHGGDLGAGPDGPPGGPGGDPMDIGAPSPGDDLGGPPAPPHGGLPHGGPPMPGGAAGGHGGVPPMPPPARPKAAPGLAFAHYDANAREFSVIRKGAGELGTRGLIREAEEVYPTHRVAKVTRNGTAVIDNQEVNLPAHGLAVITLVSKA